MKKEHTCQNFHLSIQIICKYLIFLKFEIFIQGIQKIFMYKFLKNHFKLLGWLF